MPTREHGSETFEVEVKAADISDAALAFEAALAAEIEALLARQEKVVLARLQGPKARKGTRHWKADPAQSASGQATARDAAVAAGAAAAIGSTPVPVVAAGAAGAAVVFVEPVAATAIVAAAAHALDTGYLLDAAKWGQEVANVVTPIIGRIVEAAQASMAARTGERFGPDTAMELSQLITPFVAKTVGIVGGHFRRVQQIIADADVSGAPLAKIVTSVRAAYADRRDFAKHAAGAVAVGAYNSAQLDAAHRNPNVVQKAWVSRRDSKVRETHQEADGQVRSMLDDFIVGGSPMRYPGDPTAPLSEIINCRCVMVFRIKSKHPARVFTAPGVARISTSPVLQQDTKGWRDVGTKAHDVSHELRGLDGRWVREDSGLLDAEAAQRMHDTTYAEHGYGIGHQNLTRHTPWDTAGTENGDRLARKLKAKVTTDLSQRMASVSTDDMVAASALSINTPYMRVSEGGQDFVPITQDMYDLRASADAADRVASGRPPASPTRPGGPLDGIVEVSSAEGQQVLRDSSVSALVKQWATSSNDTNALSLAIQDAAREEFGLIEAEAWEPQGLNRGVGHNEAQASADYLRSHYGHVYSAFLRAQYDATQAEFKARGVTHVRVYRGVNPPADHQGNAIEWPGHPVAPHRGAQRTTVTMRPLSSWTTDPYIAHSLFGENGWTFAAEIPVEQVLSTPRTGVGAFQESEVVVLGRPTPAVVADSEALSGGQDRREPDLTPEQLFNVKALPADGVNVDDTVEHSDWLRALAWDLPTDPAAFLAQIGGMDALPHFLLLPAARAMPHALLVALGPSAGTKAAHDVSHELRDPHTGEWARLPGEPAWFRDVHPTRQHVVEAGDHKRNYRAALAGESRMHMVMKDGTVHEGIFTGDRNFWGGDHQVGIRPVDGKRAKWISTSGAKRTWLDKGPSLGDLVEQVSNTDFDEERLGSFVPGHVGEIRTRPGTKAAHDVSHELRGAHGEWVRSLVNLIPADHPNRSWIEEQAARALADERRAQPRTRGRGRRDRLIANLATMAPEAPTQGALFDAPASTAGTKRLPLPDKAAVHQLLDLNDLGIEHAASVVETHDVYDVEGVTVAVIRLNPAAIAARDAEVRRAQGLPPRRPSAIPQDTISKQHAEDVQALLDQVAVLQKRAPMHDMGTLIMYSPEPFNVFGLSPVQVRGFHHEDARLLALSPLQPSPGVWKMQWEASGSGLPAHLMPVAEHVWPPVVYYLTHEWGHANSYDPDVPADAVEQGFELVSSNNKQQPRIVTERRMMSGYGASSDAEAYAEAFAAWHLATAKPNELVLAIGAAAGWKEPT